ncbi:MAG TPA: C2 family cysteine protease [Pirellulales bacterium]|nr:C2 family cysteine protease [Pirellulales bacterium]
MWTVNKAALLALSLAFGCSCALAQKKPSHPKSAQEPLSQLAEKHFAHWDRNHDDILELSEVDRLIEDHSVHGRQAALVVSLRHHLTKKGNPPALPRKELLKLVEEHDFTRSVERTAKHLETIDRELFLPTDPNLDTFSQGRLDDCYLLAVIAAQVHRSPKAIREMIHPEVTGGFKVVFGDGRRIEVPALTDGELLLGAKLDHRHGSWLAVLEKAYGIIRKRERAKRLDETTRDADTIPVETLNFGKSSEIISLMTGRHAEKLRLGKSSHAEQVHSLLADMIRKKRLVCAGTSHDEAPPGIVKNHAYAVLDYDVHERHVTIFNPWGNHFAPTGPPGMVHGYVTRNGLFTVPLGEFQRVFSAVVYETNRPLTK